MIYLKNNQRISIIFFNKFNELKKIEQMSEEEIMQWMKKELHENFKDIKQDALDFLRSSNLLWYTSKIINVSPSYFSINSMSWSMLWLLVQNAYLFTGEKPPKDLNHNIDQLIEFIEKYDGSPVNRYAFWTSTTFLSEKKGMVNDSSITGAKSCFKMHTYSLVKNLLKIWIIT
jgi:hypothetical protein